MRDLGPDHPKKCARRGRKVRPGALPPLDLSLFKLLPDDPPQVQELKKENERLTIQNQVLLGTVTRWLKKRGLRS